MNWLSRTAGLTLLGLASCFMGCQRGRPLPQPVPAAVVGRPKETDRSPAVLARAHAHYAAGVVHELNGEPELALQEFDRALEADPADETLVLDVSQRLLLGKHREEALKLLRGAAARKSASGEIFARLGNVYMMLGRVDEAIAANQTAIKRAPLALNGYQNLFLNLLQAKRAEEALRLLDGASNTSGANAGFLVGIADLYYNYALQFPTQRDAVKSRTAATLHRAANLQPKEPDVRLRLADGLLQSGDTKAAQKIYTSLLTQIDDAPMIRDSVRSKLVDIFMAASEHNAAREQLEALVRDDPTNPQTYYLLGSIAYEQKQWSQAMEYFRKTLLLAPAFEPAHYDLAAAELAADDPTSALATLQAAAMRFNPGFLAEYLTALSQVRLKNYGEAVKHYNSAEIIARAADPRRLSADFYFEAGVALERSGAREEAVRSFQKAIELKSDFPEAQNYLGYMWAERGENLTKARDLIALALKAEPKSAAYLDSMGWVLFKLNQPKDALEYILQAVQFTETPDATLYDHLGDIYAALHETDKAKDSWRKSLAVEDNPDVRKKIPSATP